MKRLASRASISLFYDGSDVDYSELGMQGNDHVSCNVGPNFLKNLSKKFYEKS